MGYNYEFWNLDFEMGGNWRCCRSGLDIYSFDGWLGGIEVWVYWDLWVEIENYWFGYIIF